MPDVRYVPGPLTAVAGDQCWALVEAPPDSPAVTRIWKVFVQGAVADTLLAARSRTAMGVHHFRVAPPPGPWHALTGLAGAIYASGFPAGQDNSGGRSPASALLHVVRPGGLRSIRIARGTVTTGRGPVPARFPSVPDAVSWLLA